MGGKAQIKRNVTLYHTVYCQNKFIKNNMLDPILSWPRISNELSTICMEYVKFTVWMLAYTNMSYTQAEYEGWLKSWFAEDFWGQEKETKYLKPFL